MQNMVEIKDSYSIKNLKANSELKLKTCSLYQNGTEWTFFFLKKKGIMSFYELYLIQADLKYLGGAEELEKLS